MTTVPEDYGIEATDLASLLCRFEEATNSDIDVNFVSSCILEKKQVKYRGQIIQLSRQPSDNKLQSNRRIIRIKRKIRDDSLLPPLHSPAKQTAAGSTDFESPCCLVESSSSKPGQVVAPVTTAESQAVLMKSSNFIEKTAEPRNMLISGQSEISPILDTLESVFTQNEFLFHDTAALHDFSTSVDILDHLSSPIKTEFTDEFLEIFASDDLPTNNSLFSTVAMSDLNDSHLSCIFSNGDNHMETYSHDMADVKIGHSDICMESSFINLPCDQSSLDHLSSDAQLMDFFFGSEHSYCSRLLPGIECANDTSVKPCFTAFRGSQENAFTFCDQELSQCISEILDYSCSISDSTNAGSFFIEEQEVVIDANGNDLYCHPPSQLPDYEKRDEHFNSVEAVVPTDEKDMKTLDTKTLLNNSVDHTKFIADPFGEVIVKTEVIETEDTETLLNNSLDLTEFSADRFSVAIVKTEEKEVTTEYTETLLNNSLDLTEFSADRFSVAIVKTEEKELKTEDTETLQNNSLDLTEFSADRFSVAIVKTEEKELKTEDTETLQKSSLDLTECSADRFSVAIVKTEEKEMTTEDTETLLNSSLDHTEFTADPFSEDPDVFFDKIPSYYTALSISSKPLTTTVFASSVKNIGSTDHMDMCGSSVRFDDRHYDKVPPRRRCFTNTAKEVEIEPGDVDSNIVAAVHEPEGDVHEISPTPESVVIPLTVENVAAADVQHSRTAHSPDSKAPGRCSRSPIKRSPSTSRLSRHSASSSSACSTCSSYSRCSTCSRSRSRSSNGSDRSPSLCSNYRNRSGSPVSRINKDSTETTRSQEHQQSKSKVLSSSEEPGCRSQRHSNKAHHKSIVDTEATLLKKKCKESEQMKAMEERRIVYVGKIPNGYTKKQLHQRFNRFGEIKDVKVNFREHGDNYGFVTFAYSCDAVAAKEKGNSIPGEARFDLCFGGRRHFCPDQYADLDGNREIEEEYSPMPGNRSVGLDFAALLKQYSSQQKKK